MSGTWLNHGFPCLDEIRILIGTLETLTHGNALPRKFVSTGLRTCLGERLPEKRAYAKAIFAETKRRGEGQLDAALALQPSEPKRY